MGRPIQFVSHALDNVVIIEAGLWLVKGYCAQIIGTGCAGINHCTNSLRNKGVLSRVMAQHGFGFEWL